MRGVVCVLFLSGFLVATQSKLIVHAAQKPVSLHHHPIKSVGSVMHKNVDILDLTSHIRDKSNEEKNQRDLELKHRSLEEAGSWHEEHPAYPARRGQRSHGVFSQPPKTGDKVEAGAHWASPGQRVTDYMPENFVNPLLMNHNPPGPHTSNGGLQQVAFDQARDTGSIEFDSGDFHFKIHHNQGRNFLDASKVQVGTSRLGAHTHSGSVVAKYRIHFANKFSLRPVVLVTTVPSSGGRDVQVHGSHPDVFIATVSEVNLESFVVNVVRVDSLPDNTWGQDLYLDWIAMEYSGDYTRAGVGYSGDIPEDFKAPYLQTYPAFDAKDPRS